MASSSACEERADNDRGSMRWAAASIQAVHEVCAVAQLRLKAQLQDAQGPFRKPIPRAKLRGR